MKLLTDWWHSKSLKTAEAKIAAYVQDNLPRLAAARQAGIRLTNPQAFNASGWNSFCQEFMNNEIRSILSHNEILAVVNSGMSELANRLVEAPTREENRRQEHLKSTTEQADRRTWLDRQSRAPESEPTIKRDYRSRQEEEEGLVAKFKVSYHTQPSGRRPTSTEIRTDLHTGARVDRGLIIRREPLTKILDGSKTWEMRSMMTHKRGLIGLVEKGSKSVLGVATILDCKGPIPRIELRAAFQYHGISEERLATAEYEKYTFAWILADARRLMLPVPYTHRGGVQFVTFTESEQNAIVNASIGV